MRIFKKRPGKISSIVICIGVIALFNIFNTAFHQWSMGITYRFSSARKRAPTIADNPLTTNSTYYNLANDENYNYEFRFEYYNHGTNTSPRLMILLNGSKRTCADYWDFPVGRRILAMLRKSRFSILAICSKRKKFDREDSLEDNQDVKWIYYSLQKWMNEVYFKQFKQYPRLYIHGISRGSTVAAFLSRVLPIQGQILTLFPGESYGILTRSDHSTELQTRLQLDPVFANWFYFDYCHTKKPNSKTNEFCPFGNSTDYHHYQPVPPTFFLHSVNDELFNLSDYVSLVQKVRQDSLNLGGSLLNEGDAIRFHILSPATVSPTYMKDMFDPWRSKSELSSIFYQHFNDRHLYTAKDGSRQTCACLPVDFTYYEQFPNVTETWSEDSRNKYTEYVNDIRKYQTIFCEEVCGDLYTHHAMSSRHLDKILEWAIRTDSHRRTFYAKDYLTRPLQIWMYNKSLIMPNTQYLSPNGANLINVSKSCQLYSPEYYLQEYFRQLQESNLTPRHKIQWASNPLLADYFIIPSDFTYYQCYKAQLGKLITGSDTEYVNILLANIQTTFPYWTMSKKADEMGSNHILIILSDKNMGTVNSATQDMLRNVIQVVLTGVRDDMPNSKSDTSLVYRHRYDIVIPPFTRMATEAKST